MYSDFLKCFKKKCFPVAALCKLRREQMVENLPRHLGKNVQVIIYFKERTLKHAKNAFWHVCKRKEGKTRQSTSLVCTPCRSKKSNVLLYRSQVQQHTLLSHGAYSQQKTNVSAKYGHAGRSRACSEHVTSCGFST